LAVCVRVKDYSLGVLIDGKDNNNAGLHRRLTHPCSATREFQTVVNQDILRLKSKSALKSLNKNHLKETILASAVDR
jgi:hypothetical protein